MSDIFKDKAGLDRSTSMSPEEYEVALAQLHSDIVIGKYDNQVQEEYLRLRARRRAESLLNEQTYSPPRVFDWDAVMADNSSTWLVPELIGKGSSNLLVARATIGKTFLVIDLICSAAAGRPWVGRDIGQFKTLVCLSEGQRNYARRVMAWAKANGVDMSEITPNIRLISDVLLASDRYQEAIAEHVRDFQPELVVFDTFSGTSGVDNENDAATVVAVLEATRKTCDPASVLYVHHPTKAGEKTNSLDPRGSGVLRNNVDTVLVMYDMDKRSAPSGAEFVVLSTASHKGGKVKDAQPTTIHGFYLEGIDLGVSDDGRPITSCVMRWTGGLYRKTKGDIAVLQFLPEIPTSLSDYMTAAGVSRSTAYRHLEDSKYAVRVGELWRKVSPPELDEEAILEDDDKVFIFEDDD